MINYWHISIRSSLLDGNDCGENYSYTDSEGNTIVGSKHELEAVIPYGIIERLVDERLTAAIQDIKNRLDMQKEKLGYESYEMLKDGSIYIYGKTLESLKAIVKYIGGYSYSKGFMFTDSSELPELNGYAIGYISCDDTDSITIQEIIDEHLKEEKGQTNENKSKNIDSVPANICDL